MNPNDCGKLRDSDGQNFSGMTYPHPSPLSKACAVVRSFPEIAHSVLCWFMRLLRYDPLRAQVEADIAREEEAAIAAVNPYPGLDTPEYERVCVVIGAFEEVLAMINLTAREYKDSVPRMVDVPSGVCLLELLPELGAVYAEYRIACVNILTGEETGPMTVEDVEEAELLIANVRAHLSRIVAELKEAGA